MPAPCGGVVGAGALRWCSWCRRLAVVLVNSFGRALPGEGDSHV